MDCKKCNKALPDNAIYCPYCGKKQATEPRRHKKRPNGSGTVYRMQGKRSRPWAAQKNGVWIGAYPTRAEAERALDRLSDTEINDAYNLTFSQIYEKWRAEHARTTGKSGMTGYTAAYNHCAELYGAKFRKLRTEDFQAVVAAMEGKGLSKSSCEKVVQLFGQMSKWAIREGISTTNYAQFVTINAKQKSTRQPFTAEEIAAIQRSGLPAAQIAMILLGTGCRPNELFSVTVDNCASAYFISGSKTEAGRNRVIPVSPIGLDAYTALLQQAREQGCKRLVDAYPGSRSAQNYAKRDFRKLMEEIGAEGMTPYNCRHTFTTLAVQSGVRPELLQKMVGHANYATTVGVYTHLGAEEVIAEAAKIAVTSKLQANQNSPKKRNAKSS